MSRIESGSLSAGSGAKALSRRALPASKPAAGLLPIIAATAAAGALAGGIYLWNAPPAAPPPPPPVAAPVVAAPQAGAPFNISWSSTDGPADSMKIRAGDWKWQPGKGDQQGGMVVGAGGVLAVIPEKSPTRPFVIILTVRNIKGVANVESVWCDDDAVPPFQFWTARNTPLQPQIFDVHVLFKDNYAVTLFGKAPYTVRKFERAYPHDHVALSLKNITLIKMAGRELQPGEETRLLGGDIDGLIAKLAQAGNVAIGHSDSVALPPLTPPQPEAKK